MKVDPRPTDRPIRVTFSIDNMRIGGTELNAVRTAERLVRGPYDVSVVCLGDPEGPLLDRYGSAGIAVHAFPLQSLLGVRAMRRFAGLVRFLRATRPDIVHAHDIYSNQFAVPAARLAGVPGVIASRRWWEGTVGRAMRAANSLSYRAAHRVLANSPAVARLLVQRERVAERRVVVVTNFLDEGAFEAPSAAQRRACRQRWGIVDEDVVVGIVANLTPVKDHATLFDAVVRLSSRHATGLKLVLVGDGPCRSDLEARARDLGIEDRVVFAGLADPGVNTHHHFDVSVLTSTSEAFPNSLVEAMAAGRPVVATDVGAVADAVAHGETGTLVPPRDPDALAAALDALLADSAVRASMGGRARALALERYAAHRVLPGLERLYDSLAGRPARLDETGPRRAIVRAGGLA